MRTEKNHHIDDATKDAWDRNWKGVSMERVMEIFEYPRVKENVELFVSSLPKGKKILEGGCGLAPYVIHFSRLGYEMVGVDYNTAPLERAASFKKDLRLCTADVELLPFKDNSFGGYLSLGVIEHFTGGPEKAIREARRVLEPGGCFVVKVPRATIFDRAVYPLTLVKKNRTIRKLFGRAPAEAHYWEQHFKVSELKGLLENNGFLVERIVPIDHEHGLMSFSGIFRDKSSYDGPNGLCLAATGFCKKFMPWLSAPGVVFVCRKI